MAISFVSAGNAGSVSEGAASGNTTITVPTCDFVVICFTTYHPTAGYISAGSVTLDGVAMTPTPSPADGDIGDFMGCMFYLANPSVGAGKTLAWDFGTAPTDSAPITMAFFSGVDSASPIRDSDGLQVGNTGITMTTATLTCVSGDMIAAYAHTFADAEVSTTWSGTAVTERYEETRDASGDASFATADPTGNQTISAQFSSGSDGGLEAMVLKPAAGGPADVTGTASLAVTAGVDTVGTLFRQAASDNFNRADGGLGTDWLELWTTVFDIVSNVVEPGSFTSDTVAVWNQGNEFNDDQYSEVVLSDAPSGTTDPGSGIGVCVRCTGTGGAANATFYRVTVNGNATNNVEFSRFVTGHWSTVLETRTSAFVDGDVLRVEAEGTTIRIYKNGVQLGADITDATIASGSPGITFSSTLLNGSLDDWEGGVLGGPFTPSNITGAAALAITAGVATAAKAERFAAATLAVTDSVGTVGQREVLGAASQAFTAGVDTSGSLVRMGVSSSTVTVGISSAGTQAKRASAAQAFTLDIATNVVAGTTFGSAGLGLSAGVSTVATRIATGVSRSTVALGVDTSGTKTSKGVSSSAYTVTVGTAGQKTRFGVSQSTYTVTIGSAGSGVRLGACNVGVAVIVDTDSESTRSAAASLEIALGISTFPAGGRSTFTAMSPTTETLAVEGEDNSLDLIVMQERTT